MSQGQKSWTSPNKCTYTAHSPIPPPILLSLSGSPRLAHPHKSSSHTTQHHLFTFHLHHVPCAPAHGTSSGCQTAAAAPCQQQAQFHRDPAGSVSVGSFPSRQGPLAAAACPQSQLRPWEAVLSSWREGWQAPPARCYRHGCWTGVPHVHGYHQGACSANTGEVSPFSFLQWADACMSGCTEAAERSRQFRQP